MKSPRSGRTFRRTGKVCRFALFLLLALAGRSPAAWQLTWSDEFSLPDGSKPASTNWGYETGAGGWGNNELEYYTSRTNNARIEGGKLIIEAKQESFSGSSYTSARLLTKNKQSWTYGRIEASIKLPRGQGIWPAFWMLGTNISDVGWPTCGEIDIMENKGRLSEQGRVIGTLHGPQTNVGDYNGGAGVSGSYTLPGGALLPDDYHLYAIEWTTNQIKWYVDDVQYHTVTPASLPGGGTWVHNAPEFILLNVAVGGNFSGDPDGTTVFPQQMLVDYVRVYKYVPAAPATPTGLTAAPGSAKAYVRWNTSSDATGYRVKRASSLGGPYLTITNTAGNEFTDTSLANCGTYYYVVAATNAVGASLDSSAVTAALGSFAYAVNSGGNAVGQFSADAGVTGGTIGAMATAAIDMSGVIAPAPEDVYQAERYGNMTYNFTGLITGTEYRVRLHSCETYWTSVGQRRFNVLINGTQVLTNFDIIAAAGAQNKAVVSELKAVAVSNKLTIQFVTVTDNARASGIEILLAQPATPAVTNNGPLWTGTALNLTAATVAGATYSWAGPNGFSSTNQNPVIANATTNAAGTYTLTVNAAGCTSAPATTTAVVTTRPSLTLNVIPAGVVLGWPAGQLQAATNLTGPWADVAGAVSPRTNPPTVRQEFYRLML